MPTTHDDVQDRLDAKRAALAAVLAEAGPDLDLGRVKSVPGDRDAVLAWIRSSNTELDALGQSAYLMRKTAAIPAQRPAAGGPSLGEQFVASKAYRGRTQGADSPTVQLADVDLKTLMSTSAGFAPESLRTGAVVPSAQRPTSIVDMLPTRETTRANVVYVEETTFTNPAAETAEAGTYPEAAFVFTQRTEPVRKIPVWLPVTDEQLEDAPETRDLLDGRLGFMVRQRIDGQVIVGNGTTPNLRGFLNVAGTQTRAKGADTAPDAAYKVLTQLRVTGRCDPSGWCFNPQNWEAIRLTKDTAGQYIYGPPGQPGPEYFWGLPTVQSDAMTLGTAIAGDFLAFTALAIRRGVGLQISNSHSTFFAEGKQAVRTDVRCALVVDRPAAVCSLTGL